MPFIQVIEHQEAEGELKTIYDDLVQSRGKLAEIHKIQSLNPGSIVNHMELYMTIMFGRSPLKRALREMMAVVVSTANNCAYCMEHHGEALHHFWKDEDKLTQLKFDYQQTQLTSLERALCHYAWDLTKEPHLINEQVHIKTLKKEGLEDRAILDAALVISYFNFVNRMVLGLGVHLETDGGKGYEYD